MKIDRCCCLKRTFAECKDICDKLDKSKLVQLQQLTQVGTRCGMCIPYLKRMLETGETVFREIITDEVK